MPSPSTKVDRGELQRFQRFFFCGFFFGGVKSSWMFIYLFLLFFWGGGVIVFPICFMFEGIFETNTFETPRILHVGKHVLLVLVESCHPILSWWLGEFWAATRLVGPTKRQFVEISAEWHYDTLQSYRFEKKGGVKVGDCYFDIFVVINFLEFPHISTDVANKKMTKVEALMFHSWGFNKQKLLVSKRFLGFGLFLGRRCWSTGGICKFPGG